MCSRQNLLLEGYGHKFITPLAGGKIKIKDSPVRWIMLTAAEMYAIWVVGKPQAEKPLNTECYIGAKTLTMQLI